MTEKYDITPVGMLDNAKIWYFLYRQNINLDTHTKIVSVYCLLIGFEMLLKAYLMTFNTKYCQESHLVNLKHDFKSIFEALKNENNVKFFNKIKSIMDKYELLDIDVNNLRYPKKGDTFKMFPEYLQPHNDFDDIFDNIKSEVYLKMNEIFLNNRN